MLGMFARTEHPDAREIVPSAHCIQRFRERMPVREPGREEVLRALIAALEDCHVSAWPPLWAANAELAFPLQPGDRPGRYVAITCLARTR
jgi:hypothetical protein